VTLLGIESRSSFALRRSCTDLDTQIKYVLKQADGKGKEGRGEMKKLEMRKYSTKIVNFRLAAGIIIHECIKCIRCNGRLEM
jgi:hypothetical protein